MPPKKSKITRTTGKLSNTTSARYVSKTKKEEVWNKSTTVHGKCSSKYRQDKFGTVMYKSSYGKNTPNGWEIDHSKPVSKGGTNHINNLQAMNTRNNRAKSDAY